MYNASLPNALAYTGVIGAASYLLGAWVLVIAGVALITIASRRKKGKWKK